MVFHSEHALGNVVVWVIERSIVIDEGRVRHAPPWQPSASAPPPVPMDGGVFLHMTKPKGSEGSQGGGTMVKYDRKQLLSAGYFKMLPVIGLDGRSQKNEAQNGTMAEALA